MGVSQKRLTQIVMTSLEETATWPQFLHRAHALARQTKLERVEERLNTVRKAILEQARHKRKA